MMAEYEATVNLGGYENFKVKISREIMTREQAVELKEILADSILVVGDGQQAREKAERYVRAVLGLDPGAIRKRYSGGADPAPGCPAEPQGEASRCGSPSAATSVGGAPASVPQKPAMEPAQKQQTISQESQAARAEAFDRHVKNGAAAVFDGDKRVHPPQDAAPADPPEERAPPSPGTDVCEVCGVPISPGIKAAAMTFVGRPLCKVHLDEATKGGKA